MNRFIHFVILIALTHLLAPLWAQDLKNIKKTHQLLFEDAFNDQSRQLYRFSTPDQWVVTDNGKSGKDLKYLGAKRPAGEQMHPCEFMLLPHEAIGAFVMTFDFFQRGRDFSLRDVCVVYALTNDSTYAYAQAASEQGRFSHNIFTRTDGQTQKLGTTTAPPVIWSYEKWHRVTAIRDTAIGSLQLWIDNALILETTRDTPTTGRIGIATYGSEFKIDNLKVWVPKN